MTPSLASSRLPVEEVAQADVFDKCAQYVQARQIKEQGIYPYFREISSGQDPVVTIDGREILMLGSNNYLGLSSHPEVKAAALAAGEYYGTGCAGSRLLNGTLDIHARLERKIAAFMRREDALVFSTGYQVNVGVLSCLLGRHDVAVLDSLDHASIIDGARLGFGKIVKYGHNDMHDLAAKLARIGSDLGRLIVVDGVFSMEGDLCALPEIVRLKNAHRARLMVDDAHGLGVFGANGRGTPEHFGLEDEIDLVMGTFSKSWAAAGGFVAGDFEVVDFIRHNARAQIFTASCPPATAAAVLKAVEITEREPERRAALWENTRYMKRELELLGYDTGDSESPVIPMVVGEDVTAFIMVKRLQERGVFANPVISPAVPPGRAMIRTSYMATHTREHLDRGLAALKLVGQELGLIR